MQTVTSRGLAGKAEILQSVMKDSVVFKEAIDLLADKLRDPEDALEKKDIEVTEICKDIGPKLDKSASKV